MFAGPRIETLQLRALEAQTQGFGSQLLSVPIFGKGMFSEKEGFSVDQGGGNSVNQGFGKDFYRKGNSVKRFGRFTEPPDSKN